MSPRRKLDHTLSDYFTAPAKPAPLRWGLPVTAIITALLTAAVIGASVFMLVGHESDRRTQIRDASALGYVKEFMTAYTSIDPFNANAYADNILAQGTGDFAKQFKEKQNEIVITVARAEPTTGTVLEAGVQRWNDNGSADILVATKVSQKSADGKSPDIESGNRWVVTTIEEGRQWKISNLIQVI
ncbi:mammalian cell entry protein [Mycolicibacterium arenosum]|uniref:Mammalian cell entry protein n=1 Tax=Mycolicibacterium arenosum TaxID=2952157 RepID=A0ABT1LZU4_9MYCO|nr:mammalian cell entry protein [Mycolicibacterium sp. CAU 1645]MCP9272433.1 mammalian cell entry protein [Mycolicibacterium sp. CAU 1645]